jgi:hypothetical protein
MCEFNVQEHKCASPNSAIAVLANYTAYFACSRAGRAGYSGTVTYCRAHTCPHRADEGLTAAHVRPAVERQEDTSRVGNYIDEEWPVQVDESVSLRQLDAEGRAVITQHRFVDNERQVAVCSATICDSVANMLQST